jgi:DNA-binding LytR/AlgR family response regulator
MKLHCLVIEDEPPAQEKLIGFIEQIPFLQLEGVFASAISVPHFLKQHTIDLIFLDIQLGLLNGLEFLTSLSAPPKVIITTAYASYALKGYELSVADYLLKPYSFERFYQAVTKVYESVNTDSQKEAPYLFVKTEHRLEKISTTDILYVEGMKDYLKIVTTHKVIMSLLSFKKLMTLLPSSIFIRVHHSFVVSIDKINSIERDRIVIADKLIPISQSYRQAFYQKISKRLL